MAQQPSLFGGGQFAPLATGQPMPDFTGFEGIPGTDSPIGMMIGQQVLAPFMAQSGLMPMGLHDRNVYDVLQNQRYWKQHQQLIEQAAEMDRGNWMRTMRGMAAISGTPWGAEQRQAARAMSSAAVMATPMMAMRFPDLLDDLNGATGSATVMASRMMSAGRYRLDPVTGRLGQDPSQVFATSQQLFSDLYGPTAKPGAAQGFSAGQVGSLYEQLQLRGMLAGPMFSPREGLRELAGSDRKLVEDAAGRAGFALPANLGSLSPDQSAKLLGDDKVASRMRSFDGERVRQNLEGMLAAVSAVRDIFGDAGQPNAPMSQLLSSLERLTNGSASQLQPGQLAMLVRQTQQLSKMSGISMDSAMVIQGHASEIARSLGIEPIFGVQATQGAMAWNTAYRAMGIGAAPAWGKMDANQLTQLDVNMRTNAAASQMANRMGLALRLSDTMGGFAANTDAALYVEALKTASATGQDTWIDAQGKQQQIAMGKADFYKMFAGATLANGQRSPLSVSQIESMAGQAFTNRQYVAQYEIGDVVRRNQGRIDIDPWLGQQLKGFLQGELAAAGGGREKSRAAAAAVYEGVVADIMGMDPNKFANDNDRREFIAASLEKQLAGTDAGKAISAKFGGNTSAYYRGVAGNFEGYWDQAVRHSQDFGYMQNKQNMFLARNDKVAAGQSAIMQQARFQAAVAAATAPLNKGGMISKAIGYLQGLGQGDDGSLFKLAGAALGGVSEAEVQSKIAPVMAKVNAEQAKLEALISSYSQASGDPAKQKQIASEIYAHQANLKANVAELQGVLGKAGVSEDALGSGDTADAVNWAARAGRYGELVGKAGKPYDQTRKTESGEMYVEAVQRAGQEAENVASRALSDKTVKLLGEGGVNKAETIRDRNRVLMELAAQYTGGRVDALLSDPSVPTAVRDKARAAVRDRDAAVGSLHDMMGGKGVAAGDVNAATARASALRAQDARDSVALATDVLREYGVSGEGKILAESFRSGHGFAFGTGLLEGRRRMIETGKRGIGQTAASMSKDQIATTLKSELAAAGGDPAKVKAFRSRYGLDADASWETFQRDIEREKLTGFDEAGSEGIRHTEADVSRRFAQKVDSGEYGGKGGGDGKSFPETLTLRGTLTIKGDQAEVDAQAPTATQGAAQVPMPGGG